MHIVLLLAHKLVSSSTSEVYRPINSDQESGKLVREHLNAKWIERFMCASSIVNLIETGKIISSATKQQLIEREVAFHLGTLQRGFFEGSLDELYVVNADETHFVVDLDEPWL